jgi:glycosyltransferase involved in cell wall biosynthesis
VRIGIDMLALQSPGSRGRGVGRFGRSLVGALLAREEAHEYVAYAHDGLPIDDIPSHDRVTLSLLKPEPAFGETAIRQAMERLARGNPHGLDTMVTLNPFELVPGYEPPARPLVGPRMAAVVHDLIPFLFPERYLADPPNAAWNYRRLRTLRHYDVLLTNSDATRDDCLRMLDLSEDRVVTIGGAGNGAFFTPDRSFPMPLETRAAFHRLGLRRPFVFCLAGLDERKNLRGLIDAFALLPEPLRRAHDLVVTCFLTDDETGQVRRLAEARGLAGNLILTGEVPDATLRILYQRCAAFAFPSTYEGLGLPLLEAMHCGAAVVGGKNSSQVEVVGDAGLLANAADPADLSAKLARVLDDPAFARELGERAIARADRFSWERSAERAIEALSALDRKGGPGRLRAVKPRVALVSPFPPKGSGISDYAMRLAEELSATYTVDLFHEDGYVPSVGLGSTRFSCFDHRLLRRNLSALGYRGVVYQMGNSYYHGFLYELMRVHPGVVTLHDFNLAAFHFWRAHQGGVPIDNFRWEVEYCYPDKIDEHRAQMWDWTRERGGLQEACTRRGLHLNHRIFEWAEAVVVHSPWCLEQARATVPDHAHKTVVIPMGARRRIVSPARRAEIRERFGLPRDALILGSFGILAQGKMNVEAITAFHELAPELPDALLVFVGQDWENGEAKAKVEELGLEDRVRFLGRQSDEDFADLIAVADVGICLRRPPTYGETSAALLDLLGQGVPTIITDVATFADYPGDVVRKVRWPDEGIPGIVAALSDLAGDARRREALGRSALAHVGRHHDWASSTRRYVELIERCYVERVRSRGGTPVGGPAPAVA